MSTRLQISGLEQVAAALRELPKATSKNVVRRAIREAVAPMVEDAANRAPEDTGDLAESFTVTAKIMPSQAGASRRPRRDEIRMFAGPNYSRTKGKYAPHAHLVEFGTGPRYHKKTGKFVGQAPAQPFMRPAFDGKTRTYITKFTEVVWGEIEKARKRIARKKVRAKR